MHLPRHLVSPLANFDRYLLIDSSVSLVRVVDYSFLLPLNGRLVLVTLLAGSSRLNL
jgi:hypothetical protein